MATAGRSDLSQLHPSGEKIPYVPGEVIVKFKGEVSPSVWEQANRNAPARAFKRNITRGTVLVSLLEGESVEEAVARYGNLPEVEYAQPNFVYYPCKIPNDFFFDPNLWAFNNTGQAVNGVNGTADADIDAPEAWDVETGSRDVIIAVIDTGVDHRHPDLLHNLWINTDELPGDFVTRANALSSDGWPEVLSFFDLNSTSPVLVDLLNEFGLIDGNANGFIDADDLYAAFADGVDPDPVGATGQVDDLVGWDFFDNDHDPMDPDGHGTHVAGILGAVGNNDVGVAGLGWNITVMPLKVGGSAGLFTTARLSAAIDYATRNGARIINASWGGNFFDPAVRDAISRAGTAGVIFVAAAGNQGNNIDVLPFYPASYSLANIISVAATDQNDQLVLFSNFGPQSVDVGAPGTNILSTYVKRMVIMSDSMDDGDISEWTHGGDKDSWGITDERSHSPPYSLADSPGGSYANDTKSWVKRQIDLTNGSAAVLTGLFRGSSEASADMLFVQTSTNDQDWFFRNIEISFNSESSLEQSISGSMDDVWRVFKTDIGSLDGSAGFFRFFFDTGGAIVDDGWYLDDLAISVTAQSTASDLKYLSGTSMGTPMVSALAALILSSNPGLTAAQVKSLIINGVDKKAGLTDKVASGGRINAFGSLTAPIPGTSSGGSGGCRVARPGTEPGKSGGWLFTCITVLAPALAVSRGKRLIK